MVVSRSYFVALLLVLTVIEYVPALRGGFVYEDQSAVVDTTLAHAAPIAPLRTRALTRLSYRLDKVLGEGRPWAFHATNLVLHLVNGFLVWVLAERLGLRFGAILAASVMLLHPLQSEAVAYVAGRTEVLSTCGVLLAVVLVAGSRAWWRWPAITICLVLAMSAKESAIVGIGLVAWWLAVFHRGRIGWRFVWLGGLAVVAGALAVSVLRIDHFVVADLGRIRYASWQAAALVHYARLWIWPRGLSIDHDFSAWSTSARLSALVILSAIAMSVACVTPLSRSLSRDRVTGLQCLCFAGGWIILALVLRFVMRIPEVVNEHQLYLAMAGVGLGIGILTDAWATPHREVV